MPSVPLKAQLAIRDHWTAPSSPVQTSLQSLCTLLGHTVIANPEWPLLVADLDAFYPDKANLVAIVAGCVQAWAKSMTELLEDPAHEAWADKLLEKVPVRLQLFVEVAGGKDPKGGTSWSEARDGFVVALPRRQVVQPAELFPLFRGGLLGCFEEAGRVVPLMERKAAAAADDWAGVEVDTTTGKAEVTEPPPRAVDYAAASAARPRVEFLPVVASLPRPDELFLQPPYHLSLSHGHQHIEVQCSHSPTLQLLADYLKRWCRVNHTDTRNPPAVQVKLHQSAFGLGEMFDRLTLSTEDTRYTTQFTVTSPMIVALIEGVLGYELVSKQGGWNFRRDTAFKTL
ncbi:hypothetical protein C8A05DRAFT_35319 [Staphylotrichum tortipilum]|uniref:Uncharacterized protein n=1 Tax=Staphylotrichum tortipilum TaxID=2831512 RepID=A0AAN6RT02_9PEZI|nr:hypothetical protein C8A05DRAFT_35319 [Staphylotrichum longicolle]